MVQEDKEEGTKTWTAVVWSKSLKRKIRTVYLEKLDSKAQYQDANRSGEPSIYGFGSLPKP